MIHFSIIRCPECRFPLDFNFFHISTGIGPAATTCLKCKTDYQTGREEWPFETKKSLLLFFVFSVVCIGLGALIGGNLLFQAQAILNGTPNPQNLPMENPEFLRVVYETAALLFVIQVIRTVLSVRRRQAGLKVSKYSLFSPNLIFGTQFKMLILFLLIYFIAKWKMGA